MVCIITKNVNFSSPFYNLIILLFLLFIWEEISKLSVMNTVFEKFDFSKVVFFPPEYFVG